MAQHDDATALLDEDHNKVIRLFQMYKDAHEENPRRVLAHQICQELLVHMQLEEEIFYPAFRKATKDEEVLQDAEEEHEEARKMIARIEQAPTDARLMLELEDAILHHVNDEREDMFPEARKTKSLDLVQLARQIELRKTELMAQAA